MFNFEGVWAIGPFSDFGACVPWQLPPQDHIAVITIFQGPPRPGFPDDRDDELWPASLRKLPWNEDFIANQ